MTDDKTRVRLVSQAELDHERIKGAHAMLAHLRNVMSEGAFMRGLMDSMIHGGDISLHYEAPPDDKPSYTVPRTWATFDEEAARRFLQAHFDAAADLAAKDMGFTWRK